MKSRCCSAHAIKLGFYQLSFRCKIPISPGNHTCKLREVEFTILRAIKGNIQVFSAKLLFKMDVKRRVLGFMPKNSTLNKENHLIGSKLRRNYFSILLLITNKIHAREISRNLTSLDLFVISSNFTLIRLGLLVIFLSCQPISKSRTFMAKFRFFLIPHV